MPGSTAFLVIFESFDLTAKRRWEGFGFLSTQGTQEFFFFGGITLCRRFLSFTLRNVQQLSYRVHRIGHGGDTRTQPNNRGTPFQGLRVTCVAAGKPNVGLGRCSAHVCCLFINTIFVHKELRHILQRATRNVTERHRERMVTMTSCGLGAHNNQIMRTGGSSIDGAA